MSSCGIVKDGSDRAEPLVPSAKSIMSGISQASGAVEYRRDWPNNGPERFLKSAANTDIIIGIFF